MMVVLPLIRLWNKHKDETNLINGIEIKVLESNDGFDNSGQQVDTKLVVLANNDRFMVHAYNSTQKVMVQGKNYEQFAINCLEPFFRANENISIKGENCSDQYRSKGCSSRKSFCQNTW